jgi:hypothetical protein
MRKQDDERKKRDDERKAAYEQTCRDFRLCFNTPAGARVLTYMANYCSAGQTCVYVPREGAPIDLYRTMVVEGRREAFLEIQKYLSLVPEQIFAIATGRTYQPGETDDE